MTETAPWEGHTPGPWEAHTFMVVAGRDRITHVGGNLPPPRSHEAAANAALIAAAPMHLAELIAARAEIARLTAAVKPFADACRTCTIADALSFAPHTDVDLTITRGFDEFTIPASAFAAARAALGGPDGQ